MLSNVAGARQIFERWMEWEPDEQAWHSYINMELRYKETDRARSIYERFVLVHPEIKNWVKYAKFEERQGNMGTLCLTLYFVKTHLTFNQLVALQSAGCMYSCDAVTKKERGKIVAIV